MTISDTPLSSRLRWAVPAIAAVAVGGAVVLPNLATAAPGDLAPRSAAQLLVDLSEQEATALSGTVVQTSRLGLPELPGAAGAAPTGPMSLTSGSNTLRVWADGPEKARVALLGQLAEYDVVRSGRDVWTYSSQEDAVVHYTLPAEGSAAGKPGALMTPRPGQPTALPSTPAEAADAVLAAIEPSTTVSVEDPVTVAGRAARQLVLTPRDAASLVDSVRLVVDAETSAPLRVQVFAESNKELPAFEVGFTDVTFSAPDASVFRFTTPPGADVKEVTVPGYDRSGADVDGKAGGAAGEEAGAAPTVIGTGWTSIVVMSGVDTTALAGEQGALLNQLTTRVPEGRMISTALISVLITDDGRVLAGAVTPAALRDAA